MPVRVIVLFFLLLISLFIVCSQRHQVIKQEQESSLEELTLPQISDIPELKGPFKPTNKDIQVALKNAGCYNGNIDGDIGPLTEEAIREFQAKNNLGIDGKVGPKTWAVLSKYLSMPEEENP